jgi:para-nitrobenzyl esterase
MEICVDTTAGTVRGWTDGQVASFVGIPYGESTAGVKRFLPPAAAVPWTGIKDATRFGPVCPQSLLTFDYAWNGFVGVGAENQSEDCLTLNVWTPAANRSRRLPVLFWIHGGGFGSGSPAFVNTDGMALARRGDVVVVSITHRLNVFGHLFLGEIAGESYRDSSNVGHLDIVLALEWVRDNIDQFGGDPSSVTLFGQSGGSAKIGCLMAMPAARGLFHGAVMQSAVRTVGPTLEQAGEYTAQLLDKLDLSKNQWSRLLELPAAALLQAAAEVDRVRPRNFIEPGPVADGVALPSAPIDAVLAGAAKEVRLMIGTCVNEVQVKTGGASRLASAKELLGEPGGAIVERYVAATPEASDDEVANLLATDWRFRIPSIRFAETQLAAGQRDVYMYLFGWKSAVMAEVGALHSIDIPFWFGNTHKVPVTAGDPSSAALERQVTDALVSFAGTGKPGAGWPAYEPSRRATMVFERECRIEDDPSRGDRLAWDRVPSEKLGV